MFSELCALDASDDCAVASLAPPVVDVRAATGDVATSRGAPACVPFIRGSVHAALTTRGIMRGTYIRGRPRTQMNAIFMSVVHEMVAAERAGSPGSEKRETVLRALEDAGWVDSSNRIEVGHFVDLVIWLSKRPELLAGFRATASCCGLS